VPACTPAATCHTGLARPPPQSPGLHGERTNAQEDDGEYDPAAADDEFAEAGGEGRQRQEAEEEAEFDEAAFDEAERKRRALSGAPVARSQRALRGSCSRGVARHARRPQPGSAWWSRARFASLRPGRRRGGCAQLNTPCRPAALLMRPPRAFHRHPPPALWRTCRLDDAALDIEIATCLGIGVLAL